MGKVRSHSPDKYIWTTYKNAKSALIPTLDERPSLFAWVPVVVSSALS